MSNVPVNIGTAAINQGSNLATQPITTSVAVSAGDAIVVFINIYVGSGAVTLNSVTDGTNTYTLVQAAKTTNNFVSAIAYCLSSAGLASSSTINVNLSAAPGLGYFTARATKVVGGLASVDKSATGTQASTTALSVGPTAATTQNIELVVATFGMYVNTTATFTFTAGGSYTDLGIVTATAAGDANACDSEYFVTAATGTQTATGTVGGATPLSSGGVIITFTYPATATFKEPSMPNIASMPTIGQVQR